MSGPGFEHVRTLFGSAFSRLERVLIMKRPGQNGPSDIFMECPFFMTILRPCLNKILASLIATAKLATCPDKIV